MLRLFCVLLVSVMLMNLLAGCNACEHQWEAANCKDPKTCRLCGKTTGETTDKHQWEEATTDAPKTCSVCGLTEGERIDVDERFTTNACKEVFGNWVSVYEQKGSEIGVGGGIVIATRLTISFLNNGDVRITTELDDPAAFKKAYAGMLQEAVYRNFESQAEAEAWSVDTFGKSIAAYCMERAQQIADVMDNTEELVYYVEDGEIYMAEDWDSDMTPSSYQLTEDKMLLNYSAMGREIEMSRVGAEK
jgi:hypothetical protein